MTDFIAQTEGKLARGGYRLTRQRRVVMEALMATESHPTASEVFMTARQNMPTISQATVYNSLETLVGCHVVKQVNMDREPTRYCANTCEHAHYVCTDCGQVVDVPLSDPVKFIEAWKLPEGAQITSQEVVLRGHCPGCARKA